MSSEEMMYHSHHILLIHQSPLISGPHGRVTTDWLTLNSRMVDDTIQKYWGDERHFDDCSLWMPPGPEGSPISFSCGSVIIPVWWCIAFTSKLRGGWNLISFLVTPPVLFLWDVPRVHWDKSFPWMKTGIRMFLSVLVGLIFTLMRYGSWTWQRKGDVMNSVSWDIPSPLSAPVPIKPSGNKHES